MDFCLYCIYNSVIDHELYSRNGKTAAVYKMVYQFVLGKQADIIKMMKKDGHFRPPMPFDEVRKKSHAIIGQGVKMGEGWLLPAEMVELISEGVTNIVCTQPVRLPAEPHRGQGHDPKNPRGVPAGEYRRGGLRPGRVEN